MQFRSLFCVLLIRQFYYSIAFYIRAIYITSNLTKCQNQKLIVLRQEGNKMIPAEKAKASRVNCQGPLTKHLQAFHTPETKLCPGNGSLYEGNCASRSERTSGYHYSRGYFCSFLLFFSLRWKQLMETLIKPTDILYQLLSQVVVLRFMAHEQQYSDFDKLNERNKTHC